jgi:radical SAM superfamily enzyme YgiQ (UPF0313 family)/predicted SAM-dependent methyltransferase
MSRKLHIGGKVRANGWEVFNIFPGPIVDHVGDAIDLSRFDKGTFDEIYASHTLEHFDYNGALEQALKEWARVLSPGGKIYVSVPDLETLAKLLLVKEDLTLEERFFVMRMLFGGHVDKHDYHVVGLNEEFLAHFLGQAGFTAIQRVTSFGLFNDTSEKLFKGIAISLNVVATKAKPPKTEKVDTDVTSRTATTDPATNLLGGALKEGQPGTAEQAKTVLMVLCRQTCMGSYHLPLGMGYVSACLKQAGHTVSLLNPNHSHEAMDTLLLAAIDKVQPDIVAFGGMAFHLADIKKMATLTRQHRPGAKILIGGPVVSTQARLTMTAIPEVDFGIVGEGEHTSVELLAAITSGRDLSGVLGLVYRSGDGADSIQITAPRPIEEDLDALPFVDYEGLGLDIYAGIHRPGECAPALVVDENTRVMPILTSRGCPYSCTFCCHESAGRRYRVRSLDAVFEEIRVAKERFGINAIFVFDDLFCLKTSRLEEFCRRISEMGMRWECSMSAGQIEPSMLELMKSSGCCCISVGVESMSNTILMSMKKGTTVTQVERVLSEIYNAKIGLWSNLIFGDPAETIDTVTESLEWYANHSEYNFRFAYIGYHPGSVIYDEAVNRGLITDRLDYLLSGNCEINATAMPHADFIKTRILANRYFQSFGFAGKLLNINTQNNKHIIATCRCPYCGAEAQNHTIKANPNCIASVNCPECNRAFRAPVVVRLKASVEAEAQLAKVQTLVAAKEPAKDIEAACLKLLSLDPTNSFAWVVHYSLTKAFHQTMESAISLEHAINADPYNPTLFERMDEQLTSIGAHASATKYKRKAQHLRRIGVAETYFIDVLLSQEDRKQLLDQQLRSLNLSIPVATFKIESKEAPAPAGLASLGI